MKRSTTALAAVLTLTAFNAGAAELRMSWWGGDSRHTATQEALKICGDKYGHSIAPEFTGWSGHLEKVTTQLAGGTEADIMQINWPWLPFFSIDGDGFADLNDYADVIDLSNLGAAQIEAGTMNGKLNGLPVSTTGRVFWLNKDTYDKAGVALPTTWDEVIAAGQTFKEVLGEGYFPLEGTKLDASLIVQNYLTQITGKPMIDSATLTYSWSEEEVIQGLEFYQSLVDNNVLQSWKDAAAKGKMVLHEDPNWAEGRIAGSYQWDSAYFKVSKPLNNPDALTPVGLFKAEGSQNDGVYRKASMVFTISKNSDNPKAAAEILNCMLNEPEGIDALGTSRGLPASKTAAARLEAAGQVNAMQKLGNSQVLAAVAPGISQFNEHPEVMSSIQDAMELYAYGEISAADAASDIIYNVTEVLEKYK
jgi:oligogalacturonide transport system substrate-binding protein